jgi:hypothetical protein
MMRSAHNAPFGGRGGSPAEGRLAARNGGSRATAAASAMIGLAAVVLIEKIWRRGPAAGRAGGVAALVLAVAVICLSGLAPGPHAALPMMMG